VNFTQKRVKFFRFRFRAAPHKRKSAAAQGMLKNPSAHEFAMKLRLSQQRNQALTRIEMVVIVAVLVVLVAFLLPVLAKAKRRASKINCISNIKQVGIGFRLWENDNHDKYPMAVSVTNGGAMELIATGNVAACFRVMSNELCTPKILQCPEDTHRVYATNFSTGFSDANISYFIHEDAAENYPQMILMGDNNLFVNGKPVQPGVLNLQTVATIAWTKERHRGNGNLGMADGSAQQVTSDGLKSILGSSAATNRWLIP
jgi:prepilin-type processing-associated H-X9-DG protein